ncbi:MAG: hypothetical protein IJ220_05050 [Clostridia bacterium]|nr:hypothetical protein [Clostridia bacterium]
MKNKDDWLYLLFLLPDKDDNSSNDNEGCGCFGLLVILAIIILFFS